MSNSGDIYRTQTNAMSEKKRKEELQSRRQFFKNAAKATLPIIGAIVAANIPLISRASETGTEIEYGCDWSCIGGCSGSCGRVCSSGCTNSCAGSCSGACKGYCQGSCKGTCSGGCSGYSY